MPEQTHQEGPTANPPITVTVSTNANVRDSSEPDISENRLNEYNLLQEQIKAGKYDPDGPADVAPTNQD